MSTKGLVNPLFTHRKKAEKMMTQERLDKEKKALAILREIRALESKPQNDSNTKRLRELKRQLASLDVM